jgi:hypothetical protein
MDATVLPLLTPAQAYARARDILYGWYGEKAERDFQDPLTRLLVIANDPDVDERIQVVAAAHALPFYPVPDPLIDFGRLDSARDILRAQKRVMRALGDGGINSVVAQRYISMLDALRRAHADTITEDRLLDYEETRKQVEADLDRQS